VSNLIKHSPQKEGVRRVIITTAAALHPLSQAQNASKHYYCKAVDMKGFQIEIDLQALPAGVTHDQIKPNQVWWVEKRTSLYRIYLYAGIYNPATRRINSTDALPTGMTQLTGDVTAGPGKGSQAATLESTDNVNSIISSNSTVSGSVNDIATLSSSLNTVSGNLNTVTATANAALPKSGGTVNGTLNVNATLNVNNATLNVTNGSIDIPIATGTSDNVPNNNFININDHSYIYDDGNLHVSCSGHTIWLDTYSSTAVRINMKSPVTGGLLVGGVVSGTNLSGDSGWTNPTLTNGFNVASSNTVSYRLLNNVVYLRGAVDTGTAGSSAFTLPSGLWPDKTSRFVGQQFGINDFCYIIVSSANGTVVPSTTGAWLNSVIFPITI